MSTLTKRLAQLEAQRGSDLVVVDVRDLTPEAATAALVQAHKVAAIVLVVKYTEDSHEKI